MTAIAAGGRGPKERARVALVQMTCTPADRADNLARAEAAVGRLAGRAELACLPEAMDLGYDAERVGDRMFELAEPIPGPTSERLGELARGAGIALVAGLVERDPDVPELLYDTAVLLERDGRLVGRYRKTHLYPTEHRWFRPGGELPVFPLAGLRVGVAICFELAYPAIFSTLARRGAQLIVNPSAVPVGFTYLQDLRAPARAQDNQVFVAAVNHVGLEGMAHYGGGSLVADPRGAVVARASLEAEEEVVATLDLALIDEQRRQEPVFRGFRPELYEF